MKRKRKNHSMTFKAKAALAVLKVGKITGKSWQNSLRCTLTRSRIGRQLLELASDGVDKVAERNELVGAGREKLRAKIGQLAIERVFSGCVRCVG